MGGPHDHPHTHGNHTHDAEAGDTPIPSPGIDWRTQGVKVIPGDNLDPNTAQTPGMNRATAINRARAGAEKLWAGTVHIHPDAKTGAHHHGDLESVIFVVKGKARMRWGDHLEFTAEAGPGDFIYVPPYVPHQEINASVDETLECVLVRSGQEPVVVNLDIEPVEKPATVKWIDSIHKE
ncbi:cupin domain-containing protein [Xanthobacter sp. VNH20]|uniref:cupin domain-containing protein n=1 Tax=Xanthobacter sp. VNH20 TaxID=3156616 RepID=UPI0032B579D2